MPETAVLRLIANYYLLIADLQGAVAQLGERLLCKQEVTGSIPVSSTRSQGIWDRSRHDRITAQCWASNRHRHYLFTVTRNVVLAPIIGQVRRAAIVQLHLTLSDLCKVEAAR
jgi:hypothetical protein